VRRPALVSIAALAALGPVLLWLAPTPPPHRPLGGAAAAPIGVACGLALFLALAGTRSRTLLAPLSLAVALVVAAVGTSEEAAWRAFALGRLLPVAGAWPAVAITSAGFAATHVPALRARGAAFHLVTGASFGALFVATGSLVACALAHATYNLLAVAGRSQPAAAIVLERVEKRFGRHVAVAPLDLTVEEGELVALLGPNGAGKTTLVSLLVGLRIPTAGAVRIFGGDPRDWRTRARLGVTPQEMGFPPTLRTGEILALARAHASEPAPVESVVERFGLGPFMRRQAGALSGGQRRRLALALAFVGAPRLVALDEPTTGLDVESRRAAWTAIGSFARAGGTVLLTTHSLEEAESLASRVVVLARGRVVADGTPAELKACAGGDIERAFVRLTSA
jgi:ABC-2 type transport system ATP-binding protein